MNYEKVSVNINDKKLSQMDLLIENGLYTNRSDFINQAVDGLLERECPTVQKLLETYTTDANLLNDNIWTTDANIRNDNIWFIGVSCFDKAFLERVKSLNKKINVKGFGVLCFGEGCTDELILETVESVSDKIRIKASDRIKAQFRK